MRSILQRIADGEHSAVVACVDEYGGLIWRLARRYLGQSNGEVEDGVQEVFIELWLAAEKFDPSRGSEPAFVATIAHRRLTDYQRRVTTRRKYHNRVAEDLKSKSHALESTNGSEELASVVNEYNQLPDVEQLALKMSVCHGLTQHQISEVTEAPIGTVKSRLRRAMIRLCDSVSTQSQADSQSGGVKQ